MPAGGEEEAKAPAREHTKEVKEKAKHLAQRAQEPAVAKQQPVVARAATAGAAPKPGALEVALRSAAL